MSATASYREAITGTGPLPHPRFAIYRNNIAAALIGALKVRFPAFAALAGEAEFDRLAIAFGATRRPTSPVLIAYGGDFPDFVADRLTPARAWLADVARLDSLWWRAYHAAEAAALKPSEFPASPEVLERARFRFHPAFGLLTSAWPIAEGWRAGRDGGAFPPPAAGQQWLLIRRPGAEVVVSAIGEGTFAFLTLLAAGARLADAVDGAGALAGFQLGEELRNLVAGGLVTGIDRED